MNIKNKFLVGIAVVGLASAALATGVNAAGTATTTDATGTTQMRPMWMHKDDPAREAERKAMDTALANNDYAAFQTAIAGKTKPADAPEMTEAVFAKMVEAYKLRQAGDMTGAQKIMTELGFKAPMGKGMHGHGLPPNLTDAQKQAFEQAKPLFEAGKVDEAKAILDAAGIKPPMNHERPSDSPTDGTTIQ
jgi:hypothetical protein